MSDIKCPICQNNLHKINIIVSTCTNDKCKLWGSSIPNLVLEALAQAKQDLEHTRKELEQSEICCTEWEKQALDYKAENIALSGELERTRKALEMTDTDLAIIVTNLDKVFPDMRLVFETIRIARKRIAEITALTKGDNNEMENNV